MSFHVTLAQGHASLCPFLSWYACCQSEHTIVSLKYTGQSLNDLFSDVPSGCGKKWKVHERTVL